jgi:hypothetical protein
MSKLTILSEAQLGASGAESIQVVFVEPEGIPSSVVILWPRQRSTVDPKDFPQVAVVLTRVFASAATTLAGIKSGM